MQSRAGRFVKRSDAGELVEARVLVWLALS